MFATANKKGCKRAAQLRLHLQDSIGRTAVLASLERLVPRITIGSWASARGQLTLAAAALRAVTAAIQGHASNAAQFLAQQPLKPLVRCLSLPANEPTPLCALHCLKALCDAHTVARTDLCAAGGIAALATLAEAAPGGMARPLPDLREAAVVTLASAVTDTPEAQLQASKSAHSHCPSCTRMASTSREIAWFAHLL